MVAGRGHSRNKSGDFDEIDETGGVSILLSTEEDMISKVGNIYSPRPKITDVDLYRFLYKFT